MKNKKWCNNCQKQLKIHNFIEDIKNPDGLSYFCKTCLSRLNRIKKNQEKDKKFKTICKIKENYKLYRDKCNNRKKDRIKRDPIFRLITSIRSRLLSYSKQLGCEKISKIASIVGCSPSQLRGYLIKTAVKNYGSWFPLIKYQIDHIIPLSMAKNEDEVYKLNHYTNLQYLKRKDNIRKGKNTNFCQ